ncbi:MAG: MG2 domain-containing protein [Candidatus Latescibacterota bacterium]
MGEFDPATGGGVWGGHRGWDTVDERRCRFRSAPFDRGDRQQTLVLALDGGALDLSWDFRREVVIPPARELQVTAVEAREGEQPALVVEFSDELDPDQSVEGLIGVEPADAPARLKVQGRRVTVEGGLEHGHACTLRVHAGVRSRWGTATAQDFAQQVRMPDRKPEVRFARDGVFLPSVRQQQVRFLTLNVSRVEVRVKKVFASNLGHFLQGEGLSSQQRRRHGFRDHFVSRVGVEVAADTLQIGAEKNRWLQHELDLSRLMAPGDEGLYLLSLRAGEDDLLYGTAEERQAYRQQPRHRTWEEYSSHPYSPAYVWAHCQAHKALVTSDLGLTVKRAHRRVLVWATHLEDTRPLSGVPVALRSPQDQVIARQRTDGQGLADFPGVDQEVLYVEAEHDGQRSLVKPDEMGWNLSTFDTGGQERDPEGVRAFVYTERGVYRPGDTVHVAVIARHADDTFPEGHPVTLRVLDPRDQLTVQQTQSPGRDGFCAFTFATAPSAPTGNWRMEVGVGSRTFTEGLKVETVVPQRVRVEITPTPERLGPGNGSLSLRIGSRFLFGQPAAGLEARISVTLRAALVSFPAYSGFVFADQSVDYQPVQAEVFAGPLDREGQARAQWRLPPLERAPSALEALVAARVLEPGGRPAVERRVVPVFPFPCLVGLRLPELEYGYASTGTDLSMAVVTVDANGRSVPGRALRYRLLRGDAHWWWEYENRDEYRLRFRSASTTDEVAEGEITSGVGPVSLRVPLAEEGQYLLEVSDGGGHVAAVFVQASAWGQTPAAGEDAGQLVLRADRPEYAPGEVAEVRFPVPREGRALVTLEQDARVVESRWHPFSSRETEARLRFPIAAALAPTAYATVSVIQPHAQTANDRPLRVYGVLPLSVVDPATRLGLGVRLPESLRPEEPFEVVVETGDRRPAQVTLAVVDEGLLALTNYATPDPWQAFYGKTRLGVQTADLFGQVIGADRGDVFRTFSIGGDLALAGRSDDELERLRRFEPVSLFVGPQATDGQGRLRLSLRMPNYVGAVRAMAVAARGRQYGSAERSVPVKSELMVLPSLPRVLGPGDRVQVPVTVFALQDGLEPVRVSLSVAGPVAVEGACEQTVALGRAGRAEVQFRLRALEAVGAAQVTASAAAGAARASQRTRLAVRPSAPAEYAVEERPLAPGEAADFAVPNRGIRGSQQARISVRRGPHLEVTQRARELLQYPYGCLEQVVSVAFPQLYLAELLHPDSADVARVQQESDRVIDQTIATLPRFRLADGSFAFWPGGYQVSPYVSCYAGHFVLAARDRGYHVPEELLQGWLRYQQAQALTIRDELRVRVYRAYLLPLAGEPPVGAMNLLRESALPEMDNTEKWLLAAAYRLAGQEQAAALIAGRAGVSVEEYQETGGTYGSGLRDQALILDVLVGFANRERADALAEEVALALSSPGWLSTQAAGFALKAMGRYLRSMQLQAQPLLAGTVHLPTGQTVPFRTQEGSWGVAVQDGFGGRARVELTRESGVSRAFAVLAWEGIPLAEVGRDESHHLQLAVEWLDGEGQSLDPRRLPQGRSFWGRFTVRNLSQAPLVEEVALEQVLPAGWEIENTRLSNAQRPEWMHAWSLRCVDPCQVSCGARAKGMGFS